MSSHLRYTTLDDNPNRPQLPVGTEVALVRQALLVDSSGDIVPSHLTELVELRVFRNVTPLAPLQEGFEFTLNRTRLFGGDAGGLIVTPNDHNSDVQFQRIDIHDAMGKDWHSWRHASDAMMSCAQCHTSAGILSVEGYVRAFQLMSDDSAMESKAALIPTTPAAEAKRVIAEKQRQPDWQQLRKYWDQP